MNNDKIIERKANIPYKVNIYIGFILHSGVPKSPKIAPTPYPNINNIPLVVSGAIGKVNSDAKFIDTGIIGTIKTPNTKKLAPTSSLLRLGIVNIVAIAESSVIAQIILVASKGF